MNNSPILINTLLRLNRRLTHKKIKDIHKLKKFSAISAFQFTQYVQKEMLAESHFGTT